MTKRANGTGSVYKRKNRPGWTASVVVGYKPDGTPLRYRKAFRTKTEALQAVSKLKNEVRPQVIPTVSYYYEAFCKGRGASISKDKKKAYEIAYNRLEKIQGTPISELTIPQLQEIVNQTCSSYYPARDVKVLLNHLFKLAAVDGNANPALPGLLELPKLQETKREPFTEEEQIALWLSYEAGNKGAAIPLIMIYTGMMTGEMRSLTKSMINWDTQEIVGVGMKTETRREATVLISDDIVPVLQDVASQATGERLFTMGEADFYAAFYQALKDAGITRHLTPYSCRHTTATALSVNAQVAPQTVQRIMRWSSTKMMDRYVHPGEKDAREAINKI